MGSRSRLNMFFSFWAFASWAIALNLALECAEFDGMPSLMEEHAEGGPALPPLNMASVVIDHFFNNEDNPFWMDERDYTDHLKVTDACARGGSMRAIDVAQNRLMVDSIQDNKKPRKTFDDAMNEIGAVGDEGRVVDLRVFGELNLWCGRQLGESCPPRYLFSVDNEKRISS